jgi:ligand-binding SRPBCC domain-containing protein
MAPILPRPGRSVRPNERMARGFLLSTRLFVARDLETTFGFFADAGNLQRLTPPWLDFSILTPQPIPMRTGTLIDYRIRLHGIPVRWRTEIADWAPPVRFVDQQLRGPYRLWHHTHTFTATDDGTLVEDTVRYRPLGGRLVHALFVKRDLERIFTYRQEAILKAFGVPARDPITVHIARVLL